MDFMFYRMRARACARLAGAPSAASDRCATAASRFRRWSWRSTSPATDLRWTSAAASPWRGRNRFPFILGGS